MKKQEGGSIVPCSTWEEVAGKRCGQCGGYATHYYRDILTCCDCHGGRLVSQADAKREHERIIIEKDHKIHEKKRQTDPFSGNPDEW